MVDKTLFWGNLPVTLCVPTSFTQGGLFIYSQYGGFLLYNWLKKEVGKFKMKPEEALIVTIDGANQIFCQKKSQKKG